MEIVKKILREVLIFFKIDLTKNLEYDRLTRIILKKNLERNFNCIDVGCHKGEILDMMLKFAPQGQHFAFEPIPFLYKRLDSKYKKKAIILPYAIADFNGSSSFQLVNSAPAYSGIKRRSYKTLNPDIEEIQVEVRTLDELIESEVKIQLIKIDVEGGELGVLKGASQILTTSKPLVIFEFGKGASDFYNTQPADVFNFLSVKMGLNIYTLQSFVSNKVALTESELYNLYETNKEYYFIASPS